MSATRRPGYWGILRTKRVLPLLAAGALGRLPGGILPFALVVAFAQRNGFALAGGVAAVFMLSTALTGPRRGRLVDRYGRRSIVALTGIQAASTVVAVSLLANGWAVPALVGVCLCGATAPPVSAALRTRWSAVFADKDQLRHAHSVDSIAEELTFVAAPLLTTVMMRLTTPLTAVVIGSLIYFAAVGVLMAIPDSNTSAGREHGPGAERTDHGHRRSLISQGVGQGIILPLVALGVFSGGVSVVLPAIAAATGDITSAGFLFAVFSVGGAVGGIIHGRVRTSISLKARYLLITGYLTVATVAVAATATLTAAYATVFVAGAAVTPMFVVGYLLVDERLTGSRQSEANAWLGSGYNFGSGAGSALCGLAVANVAPGFVVAALSLATLLGTLSVLRIPSAASAPQPIHGDASAKQPAG